MTVIEIRPHRWGWKAFEARGVEPVFSKKDQTIDYAQNRACFRSGQIRVLDLTGKLERTIVFGHRHDPPDLPSISTEGICSKHVLAFGSLLYRRTALRHWRKLPLD